ncbi:hypothetical protein HDV05_001709 [Chytridiales sp. JEL 0842]|nr:hypothetical protein HDV05_001709 [Chytridiales sp. JEL 0842]
MATTWTWRTPLPKPDPELVPSGDSQSNETCSSSEHIIYQPNYTRPTAASIAFATHPPSPPRTIQSSTPDMFRSLSNKPVSSRQATTKPKPPSSPRKSTKLKPTGLTEADSMPKIEDAKLPDLCREERMKIVKLIQHTAIAEAKQKQLAQLVDKTAKERDELQKQFAEVVGSVKTVQEEKDEIIKKLEDAEKMLRTYEENQADLVKILEARSFRVDRSSLSQNVSDGSAEKNTSSILSSEISGTRLSALSHSDTTDSGNTTQILMDRQLKRLIFASKENQIVDLPSVHVVASDIPIDETAEMIQKDETSTQTAQKKEMAIETEDYDPARSHTQARTMPLRFDATVQTEVERQSVSYSPSKTSIPIPIPMKLNQQIKTGYKATAKATAQTQTIRHQPTDQTMDQGELAEQKRSTLLLATVQIAIFAALYTIEP